METRRHERRDINHTVGARRSDLVNKRGPRTKKEGQEGYTEIADVSQGQESY